MLATTFLSLIRLALEGVSRFWSLWRYAAMSGYRVPTFNLTCNIWRAANDVQANAPDVVTVASLVNGRSGGFILPAVFTSTIPQLEAALTRVQQTMSILVPKLTDIRGSQGGGAQLGDTAELPAGSGRFYLIQWVDDVGKGFANEHREGMLWQWTLPLQVALSNPNNVPNWPYPTP